MDAFRAEVMQEDAEMRQQKLSSAGYKASHGYGGKFGVETDRMDKSAMGHDYQEKLEQHASQKDYAKGFGGKYGVQKDRIDQVSLPTWLYFHSSKQPEFCLLQSAVGWDHVENVEKHQSQKDYKTGFGGEFGVQSDRVDKSAVGWEHVEKVSKHESQKGGRNVNRIRICLV